MRDAHWTDDELVARLYGAGPENPVHLDGCAQCGARWQGLLERRKLLLGQPSLKEGLLEAQRHAILSRLDGPSDARAAFRMIPSFALAALAVVALGISTPSPKPLPAVAQTDAQMWNDVFARIAETAPAGVAPVEKLFEVRR